MLIQFNIFAGTSIRHCYTPILQQFKNLNIGTELKLDVNFDESAVDHPEMRSLKIKVERSSDGLVRFSDGLQKVLKFEIKSTDFNVKKRQRNPFEKMIADAKFISVKKATGFNDKSCELVFSGKSLLDQLHTIRVYSFEVLQNGQMYIKLHPSVYEVPETKELLAIPFFEINQVID
jgi:hypothetical protein